jgi:sulfur-carrier protein
MTIHVYAILKDYFDREFTLSESPGTVDELRAILIGKKPEASRILTISRFAVDDEFVDNDFSLNENDHISILPPSSGG